MNSFGLIKYQKWWRRDRVVPGGTEFTSIVTIFWNRATNPAGTLESQRKLWKWKLDAWIPPWAIKSESSVGYSLAKMMWLSDVSLSTHQAPPLRLCAYCFVWGFFGRQDLSSMTKDQTPSSPAVEARSPKHWTTRGVPVVKILSMLLNFKIQIKDQLHLMTAKRHVTLLYA